MADSTINGLTALTGANVDNTADQLAIWDNSDSTTKKITRTELMVGLPAGTAAAPAISFSGSAGTGMYLNASNEVSISTNGNQALRISSAQRVLPTQSGNAGAPSIARSGDQTTGFFWPTANTLGFSTGGAEAMRIDSAQRLLVGGTATFTIPDGTGTGVSSKIYSIATSGTASIAAFVNDGTNNRRIGLFVDQTNALCGISSNASLTPVPFVYRDATAERLRIDENGRVGIGVTNPATTGSTLVSASVNIAVSTNTAINSVYSTNVGGIDTGGSLGLGGHDGVTAYRTYGTISARKENATSGDVAGYLSLTTRPSGGSNTERLRITSTGNVIVNTAAVATTATDGFLYVSSCAGTPTGTPTSYTGRVPIVVDTTNNKLYFYSGGAWRDAGP